MVAQVPRSILVVLYGRFGQRHVAIRIRTQCALGATIARRDVAVGFAARVAFGPRSLSAGTLAAELTAAALTAAALPTRALPAATAGTTA